MADEKVTKLTAEQKAELAAKLAENIEAGVTAGDILRADDEVSAKVDGNREIKKAYQKLTAANTKGALILSGGSQADMLKDFNYAYDLGVRANVRQQILAANEGPEKAIEKGVKGLLASVPGMSESVARGIVVEQRKEMGLPV